MNLPRPGEVRTRWWVKESAYPALAWCRASVLADGSWELVDCDGGLERFLDEPAARAWLADERYVPFDAGATADLKAAGAAPEDLRSPERSQHTAYVDTTADCTTCAANWEGGVFGSTCEECGGGAMIRACPLCAGRCGATWRRAVLDSNDSGEAHWTGCCLEVAE